MGIVQKSNGLYILGREDFEHIATVKLKEYSPSNLEQPKPLNATDFLENYLGLVVKNRHIIGFGILGLTVMSDVAIIPSCDEGFSPILLEETFGTVLISPYLLGTENIGRRRYTEMHEASHFILHRSYFERASSIRKTEAHGYIACREVEVFNKNRRTDEDWLEYQADALAAALLMPRDIFAQYTRKVMHNRGILSNYIAAPPYVSKSKIRDIISEVADVFRVSYRAAYIRMRHLGLIQEVNISN